MNCEPNKSLYIGNLDYEITKVDIEDLFSDFGRIEEITLLNKKGIAFVKLDNYENAELAKKALDGITLLNRTLYIDWARPIRKPAIK